MGTDADVLNRLRRAEKHVTPSFSITLCALRISAHQLPAMAPYEGNDIKMENHNVT